MGQRRVEREWERPRNTRHVWLRPNSTLEAPCQAFVLAWVRHSYRWQALVVRVDQSQPGNERIVQEWVPLERLAPVRTDPNTVLRYSWLGEVGRPAAPTTRKSPT